MNTTTNHYAAFRTTGDYGYEDGTLGDDGYGWVLEDAEGMYLAPLELPGSGVAFLDPVEVAVAAALGIDPDQVWASPAGANVGGDASHRNVGISAGEWYIEIHRSH